MSLPGSCCSSSFIALLPFSPDTRTIAATEPAALCDRDPIYNPECRMRRAMATVAVDDKLLKHITDTIVEKFHPRRIILFGSHARGDPRPDSDVDLLVVMDSEKDRFARAIDIGLALADRHWAMD